MNHWASCRNITARIVACWWNNMHIVPNWRLKTLVNINLQIPHNSQALWYWLSNLQKEHASYEAKCKQKSMHVDNIRAYWLVKYCFRAWVYSHINGCCCSTSIATIVMVKYVHWKNNTNQKNRCSFFYFLSLIQ